MILKDIISDIKRILTKSKISDDSRIQTRHLEFKVHQYRAIGIRQKYNETLEIDPAWLQDLRIQDVAKINSSDEPAVSGCNCVLGKFVLPSLVILPEDKGLFRISTSSRQTSFYPISLSRFYFLVDGTDRSKHQYTFRIGNTVYISPFFKQVSVQAILDRPLDAGITNKDIYPMSFDLLEFVVMKILTQDFNIEQKIIADIRNDAADQLRLLQPRSVKQEVR